MKKFWSMVSKKDFIFGIIIFLLVVVITAVRPSNKVRVAFSDTEIDIRATKFEMIVPYDLIDHIELVEKPDAGIKVNGRDDGILLTGTWNNDAWGEYEACIEQITDNCIVMHLTDGRTFVISRRDNEETANVFEEFQTYLNR